MQDRKFIFFERRKFRGWFRSNQTGLVLTELLLVLASVRTNQSVTGRLLLLLTPFKVSVVTNLTRQSVQARSFRMKS